MLTVYVRANSYFYIDKKNRISSKNMYVHYLLNAVTRILHLIFYIDIFASRSPFYIFVFILVIIKYINILTDNILCDNV